MGDTATHPHPHMIGRGSAELIATGSSAEAIGGGGAIVLSIVGLGGILQSPLLAIAGICVGGGLLFEGGAVAARSRRILANMESDVDVSSIGGGASTEFIAGVAGIVLSILAVLGVVPDILMPVAALVYGGAIALGSGTTARLRRLNLPNEVQAGPEGEVLRDAIAGAAGVQVLTGLGAVVLGIIALVSTEAGMAPVLSLVAMLALGVSILLSGTTLAGKMMAVFEH